MAEKPIPTSSKSAQELDRVEAQFKRFDEQVQSLTLDKRNEAPLCEIEPQTKLSNREMHRADEIYMKPVRSIECKAKFNEHFRSQWEEKKKYVKCIVENLEIVGEKVEAWSKPFAGVPYEFWQLPTNKPLMIPRYLAEQLARRFYHRFIMEEGRITSVDGSGTYHGAMVAKETRRRIDCRPVGDPFVAFAA